MPFYRVTWEIDLDAESPREAAEKARYIQEHNSSAHIFSVRERIEDIDNEFGLGETVDLDELCSDGTCPDCYPPAEGCTCGPEGQPRSTGDVHDSSCGWNHKEK